MDGIFVIVRGLHAHREHGRTLSANKSTGRQVLRTGILSALVCALPAGGPGASLGPPLELLSASLALLMKFPELGLQTKLFLVRNLLWNPVH